MNKLLPLTLAGLAAAAGAQAQETGRVLSSTPVIQQVQVPRQVCTTAQVAVPQQPSGAGALMGAIAGGAVGNQIGDGSGRAVATIIGLAGGALLGNRIEGTPPAQVQNVQNCTTQVFYENRAVSYNVVYEFNGKQYTVNMPNDPGPTVQLQVTPVGGLPQQPSTVQTSPQPWSPPQPMQLPMPQQAPVSSLPTTTVISTTTLPSAPVYMAAPVVVAPAPVYYARPYVPPVSLSIGYSRGWGPGWGHGHPYRGWR